MIFSTQSNAKRHFRNQHTNTERIPCRLCQRTFKNTHSHNEHLRINHGVTQSMLKAQPLIKVDKSWIKWLYFVDSFKKFYFKKKRHVGNNSTYNRGYRGL